MTKAPFTEVERKDLVQLVRFCISPDLKVICHFKAAGQNTVVLSKPDAAEKVFRHASLSAARSLGLIAISENRITCLASAKPFLKRALGPDEEWIWLRQHSDIVSLNLEQAVHKGRVQLNLDESPLASLARLRDKSGAAFLPQEAIAAGERLHKDFMRAQLQPRITQSFAPKVDISTQGGGSNLSDTAIAARIRFNKAIDAMGPDLHGVAVDVCCFAKGLEMVEHERGWPQRSAKLMLRTALLALHRHYNPPPPPSRSGMQHWGSDDYRPELKR